MRIAKSKRQPTTPRRLCFFLTFIGGGLFFSLSWCILLLKFYSVRNSGRLYITMLELLSITMASVAHMLFSNLLYTRQLLYAENSILRCCGAFFACLRSIRIRKRSEGSTLYNLKSHASVTKLLIKLGRASGLPFRAKKKSLVLFVLAFLFLLGIHILVHWAVPYKHRQSQEIFLGLIRFFVDGTVWTVSSLLCLHYSLSLRSTHVYSPSRAIKFCYEVYICAIAIFASLAVLAVLYFLSSLWSMDTVSSLRVGILEEPCDPCEGADLRLDPVLRRSWVLPEMIPWNLVARLRGDNGCRHNRGRDIGYINETTEMLIVSSLCSDGSKPRIFLERPEDNEMSGNVNPLLDEIFTGNKKYHAELETKYGTPERAASEGVIVYRNAKTGFISAVEINPSTLTPVSREASSKKELDARLHWPSEKVLEVPLGRSAAYMVRCPAMNHEEFFLFPVKEDVGETSGVDGPNHSNSTRQPNSNTSSNPNQGLDEPAGNVLIILFDALSRQGAHRSLPGFVKWVRDFQKRQLKKPTLAHRAYEPKAISTLGHSTAGNLCPYITGTTIIGMSYASESEVDMMGRTIFNLAKEKHGPALSTAFTAGFCHDFFEAIVGNREPNGGTGGRLQGVDYYLYQPLCHLAYSGMHSNYEGPYSIFRRCIDGRQVHEHLLDYTTHLLRRQLGQRAAAATTTTTTTSSRSGTAAPNDSPCDLGPKKGKYFFDISYFTESHEGTHGVIRLVDDALVAFMRHLEEDLRFFDDPLNTFIFASDHGNHMGPYYEYTNAGKFERTTPAMLYIMHPEVMRRVDLRKGRPEGESMINFEDRMKHLSTPLDFYMTLGDLTGISVTPFVEYMRVESPPASLFDSRGGAPIQKCSDFLTELDESPCSLHYCTQKDRS